MTRLQIHLSRWALVYLLAGLLALAGVAVVSAQIAGQMPGPGQPVYVTLRDQGAVAALGSQGWETTAGAGMTYVAVTRNNQIVLATSSGENRIYVFNAQTGEFVKTIDVGNTPKGVKVSPTQMLALVANEGDSTLSVIDMRSLEAMGTIPVGTDDNPDQAVPHNIVYMPNGKYAYVTLQEADAVAVIDMDQLAQVDTIPIPGGPASGGDNDGPHNLDIAPDGRTLYVANRYSDTVAVIELATGNVTQKIAVSRGHHGLDASPNGRWIYVSGIGANVVNVIDASSGQLVDQIDLGNPSPPGPHGLRTSIDGRTLYVTLTSLNQIVVIDTASRQIVDRIDTGEGSFPFWIAVPGNH